jgi:hypothetical protein
VATEKEQLRLGAAQRAQLLAAAALKRIPQGRGGDALAQRCVLSAQVQKQQAAARGGARAQALQRLKVRRAACGDALKAERAEERRVAVQHDAPAAAQRAAAQQRVQRQLAQHDEQHLVRHSLEQIHRRRRRRRLAAWQFGGGAGVRDTHTKRRARASPRRARGTRSCRHAARTRTSDARRHRVCGSTVGWLLREMKRACVSACAVLRHDGWSRRR